MRKKSDIIAAGSSSEDPGVAYGVSFQTLF